jgi:hypothetical protein
VHAPAQRWPALCRFIEKIRNTTAPDAIRVDAMHQLATVAAAGLFKHASDEVTRLHAETLLARYPAPRAFLPEELDDFAVQCGSTYFSYAPEERRQRLGELLNQMRRHLDEEKLRSFADAVADRMLALNLEGDANTFLHAAALREPLDATVH